MRKAINFGLLGFVFSSLLFLFPASAEISQETMIDVFKRLDDLEKKTRELHGDNEVLRHELDKLKKVQKDGFLNVDERVEALASKVQAVSQTSSTKATEEKSSADGGDTKEVAASKATDAAKPETASSEDKAAAEVKEVTKKDTKEGIAKDSSNKKPSKRAPTKYEKETYQAAFEKMKKSPTGGTLAFQEYIKMQPDSPLTPNAQYWIGEIKYSHNNYKGAVDEFIKVLQNYKYSDKAPDAAIKLGYSFYALKNWVYARRTFEDVLKYFPDNANAVNLAKKRLAKMDAAGN